MLRISEKESFSLFRNSTPDHWPERFGSYIIAVSIGFAAAAIAYVTPVYTTQKTKDQLSLPLIFALSPALEVEVEPLLKDEVLEPEPLPEEVQLPNPEPEFIEAAATTVKLEREETDPLDDSEEPMLNEEIEPDSDVQPIQIALASPSKTPLEKLQEQFEEPVPEEPTNTEPELPPSLEEWKPDNAIKERQLNELMNRVSEGEKNLQQKRDSIRAELNRREVETTGREFLFNSDGGREGMIRLLDVEGFPQEVVRRVYARYGIDVEYRYLRPEDLNTKRTYFNKVITNDESFTTKREEGYYEVFQLSSKAISLLAGLEREAITSQQRDPRNTRVRSVTFGIVLNDRGEYALGVTDLQFERLR